MALLRNGVLVAGRDLGDAGQRHARSLVVELRQLLSENGHHPREVGLVAVSIGPGSFTGLRVGVVCAKTWAYATGCRLIGVETFSAIVHGLSAAGLESSEAGEPRGADDRGVPRSVVWAIDDALRGDVYSQRFESAAADAMEASGAAGRWVARGPVALRPFSGWINDTAPGDLICGPGATRWRAELAGRGLRIAAAAAAAPSATSVARLGWDSACRGAVSDPFKLVPLYVRRSAAEEKLDPQPAGAEAR